MRNIFTVNATQVVTSESHPEGTYSVLPDYPKNYDSRNYGASEENPNGSEELALIVAQAEYSDRVKQLALSGNRAMWTVTLTRSDGQTIQRMSKGAFPDMTSQPEPEPEPEESEGPEEE